MGAKMRKNLWLKVWWFPSWPEHRRRSPGRGHPALPSPLLLPNLKHTQSPIFLAVRADCAARCSSCLAFPMVGPRFSAVCHFFAKNIEAEITELFPRRKGKKKVSSRLAGALQAGSKLPVPAPAFRSPSTEMGKRLRV